MFKKKRKYEIPEYEETASLSTKENEIMSSYFDDYESYDEQLDEYEDFEEETEEIENKQYQEEINELNENSEYEDYEDEVEEEQKGKNRNYKRIINVLFSIIIIILAMVATDVILVARYNAGPFFAIPLTTYKDGGSKAYYGFGYKVIKYKQLQGRRDKEIGFWNLKYNVEPVTLEDLDLAIEMYGNEIKTYKKYYKKFIRLHSTLEEVDTNKNKILLSYKDEGKKYTLEIECNMATKNNAIEKFEKGKEITIIGTVTDFKYKSKTNPNKLIISNCFAEQ